MCDSQGLGPVTPSPQLKPAPLKDVLLSADMDPSPTHSIYSTSTLSPATLKALAHGDSVQIASMYKGDPTQLVVPFMGVLATNAAKGYLGVEHQPKTLNDMWGLYRALSTFPSPKLCPPNKGMLTSRRP